MFHSVVNNYYICIAICPSVQALNFLCLGIRERGTYGSKVTHRPTLRLSSPLPPGHLPLAFFACLSVIPCVSGQRKERGMFAHAFQFRLPPSHWLSRSSEYHRAATSTNELEYPMQHWTSHPTCYVHLTQTVVDGRFVSEQLRGARQPGQQNKPEKSKKWFSFVLVWEGPFNSLFRRPILQSQLSNDLRK